jgi:hypothetical protein
MSMSKNIIYSIFVLITSSLITSCTKPDVSVKVYPAPAGEILYDGYTVRVNGQDVPVYQARVSAVPLNWRWPGYQRPLYQTEFAGFCSWDMEGPVTVEVTAHHVGQIDQVVIRPQSYGIESNIRDHTIRFTLNEPSQVTLEVNGMHHALHLFGNPMEEAPPNPDDPGVLYFGPGIHDIGKVDLEAGQTVYISGGAVVYGAFEARDAHNLSIRGRGILDGSHILRPDSMLSTIPEVPFGTMALYGCHHTRIEGITFRDANVYVLTPVACRAMSIANIKQIGMWRYNTDGIHLKNCQNVKVDRCFLRNFDDSFVVNGYPELRGYKCGDLPMENVTLTRSVIWNDWDMAIRIGVTCIAPVIQNILIQDCDIIHASIAALNIDNHGHAMVRDIRFEDIRIEMDDGSPKPVLQREHDQVYKDPSDGTHVPMLALFQITKSFYAKTEEYGHIKDVLLKNITITGDLPPPSAIRGYNDEHMIENIDIENLRFGDRIITDLESGHFEIGDFVTGVKIKNLNLPTE